MKIYAEPYVKHEIGDFIRMRVRRSKNTECNASELFEVYKKWCRENNTLRKSRHEFYAGLEKNFTKVKDGNGKFAFLEVKLPSCKY